MIRKFINPKTEEVFTFEIHNGKTEVDVYSRTMFWFCKENNQTAKITKRYHPSENKVKYEIEFPDLDTKFEANVYYTLYAWRRDDEGGYSICYCGEFTPDRSYDRYSGPWAMPSEKIGDFYTAEQLVDLYNKDIGLCVDDEGFTDVDLIKAQEWIDNFENNKFIE